LRIVVDQVRAAYPITAKVIFGKANAPSEAEFTSLLVDEQSTAGPSYQRFLELCSQEVSKFEKGL
jgi:GTP cyclohydrolase III